MKPYYDHAGITIFCGDCREILPQLPKVDAVITDPPYMNLAGGFEFTAGGVAPGSKKSMSVGDEWIASLDWLDLVRETGAKQLVTFTTFGGMRDTLMRIPGEVKVIGCWYKRNTHPGNPLTPHYSVEHYIGTKLCDGADWRGFVDHIDVPQDFGGCVSRGERIRNADGSNAHPTQKPIDVMQRLIPQSAQAILDPFMGSGTTLVAAKNLSRKAIGIEIEEKYCEIAVRRLEQEILPFSENSQEPKQREEQIPIFGAENEF